MEIREWATRILSGDTLEEKLLIPNRLTDTTPGAPIFWKEPTRPTHMTFSRHKTKNKLPSFKEHHDPDKRAVCLHRFAGHELLAVEIMAYALLAFPEAPKHFRRGIANTLREEQDHVRLYCKRLEKMGVSFGDMPLYKHFWAYTPYLRTPEEYLSVMSLTFEMANLDFAPMYGASFAKYDDHLSSDLMKRILEDEIAHVSFGWNWLNKLKKESDSNLETWLKSLPPNLPPSRAMGPNFQEEPRRQAGLTKDWMEMFAQVRAGSSPQYSHSQAPTL